MKDEPMYREEILDIYSERPNFGKLQNKTHEASLKNDICDDEINLELEVENGLIKDAGYTGKGCVICIAGASLLTEKIKGMKLEDAQKLTKEDVDELFGMKIIPLKIKCELLTLEALKRIK